MFNEGYFDTVDIIGIAIVVSGHGLIQQRKIGSDQVLNFEVSGEKIEAVHMLPGYTHNIINLSDTETLVFTTKPVTSCL